MWKVQSLALLGLFGFLIFAAWAVFFDVGNQPFASGLFIGIFLTLLTYLISSLDAQETSDSIKRAIDDAIKKHCKEDTTKKQKPPSDAKHGNCMSKSPFPNGLKHTLPD